MPKLTEISLPNDFPTLPKSAALVTGNRSRFRSSLKLQNLIFHSRIGFHHRPGPTTTSSPSSPCWGFLAFEPRSLRLTRSVVVVARISQIQSINFAEKLSQIDIVESLIILHKIQRTERESSNASKLVKLVQGGVNRGGKTDVLLIVCFDGWYSGV